MRYRSINASQYPTYRHWYEPLSTPKAYTTSNASFWWLSGKDGGIRIYEILYSSVRDTAGGNWATHLVAAVEARNQDRALITAQLIHLGMSDGGILGGEETKRILR
eukprot:COSAG01_NODE_34511_length_546_cov_1.261745_1_plen_105_part_01